MDPLYATIEEFAAKGVHVADWNLFVLLTLGLCSADPSFPAIRRTGSGKPRASQAGGLPLGKAIRITSTRPIKRAFDAEETQEQTSLGFFDLAVATPSMKAAEDR